MDPEASLIAAAVSNHAEPFGATALRGIRLRISRTHRAHSLNESAPMLRNRTKRTSRYLRGTFLGCLVVSLAAAPGCQSVLWRGQDAKQPAAGTGEKSTVGETKYVGDVTAVWGMNFAKVENICLVTQLKGTGSDPPLNLQREQLIKEMQTHRVQNPEQILASGTTSMAIVGANLPPGIRKGDRFDVYVEVMPRSETTSLRGGFVMPTHIRQKEMLGGGVKQGHDAGLVSGRIYVREMFESRTDPTLLTSGYLLGGGVAEVDRPLGLAIRDEAVSIKTAVQISRAINARFKTYIDAKRSEVAIPKNNVQITLLVPEEYRQNVGRFVRVIVNFAFDESAQERINRIELLERELHEPALAQQAALRLEAIGGEAIPALKRALQHDDAEVRFYAAEALTYMDQSEGLTVLKETAERDPSFRWHALTALASSEELAAGMALTDLFHSANAETRYGAFRAMFARSPQDPMIVGRWAPGEFFLHLVPTSGPSMIHLSTQNRPEIVVFGGHEPVADNFLFVENGLTIQTAGPGVIELVRYLPGKDEVKLKCKNSVCELINMMVDGGCDYETLFTMCKDAQKTGTLNCRVVVNRVPKSERLYNRDASLVADEAPAEELERANTGDVPSLFESPPDASMSSDRTAYPDVALPETPKKGVFATMKSWFTGN